MSSTVLAIVGIFNNKNWCSVFCSRGI